MRSVLVCGLLAIAAWPTTSGAQVALQGRLLTATGEPIPGARVDVGGIGFGVPTVSAGRFALSGQPGATLQLYFSAPGFRRDSGKVLLGRRSRDRDFTMTSDDVPLPEANPSDNVVGGRVVDESGVPLSYANIQVNHGTRFIADDSGRFQFSYTAQGSATIFVRRIGFEPAEFRVLAKPDTALGVVLTAIPTMLKEVSVKAESPFRSLDLHGFYERMRDVERGINHGYFITPEDLDRRKPNTITQMAEGFPNIRVLGPNCGPPAGSVICGPNNCKMTVYVDNIRVQGRLGGRDYGVNEVAFPTHVAGMEIYPRGVGAAAVSGLEWHLWHRAHLDEVRR
jgi:hypothetical protein